MPSHGSDYEKGALATEKDDLLNFFATSLVENANVARKTSNVWSKVVAIFEYWKCFPKYKQLRRGDQKSNKSHQVLLQNHTDHLVSLYFQFFEVVATKLNRFVRPFQTNASMLPFLVDTLEEIKREFCTEFIIDGVMERSTSTTVLIR